MKMKDVVVHIPEISSRKLTLALDCLDVAKKVITRVLSDTVGDDLLAVSDREELRLTKTLCELSRHAIKEALSEKGTD